MIPPWLHGLRDISSPLLPEAPTCGQEVTNEISFLDDSLTCCTVPSQWRTLSGDMDPTPAFLDVFKNEFDALSPWTIGRYSKLDEIDRFCEERMTGDFKELKDLPHRVDYFPTIWPGGSVSTSLPPISKNPTQTTHFTELQPK
jgi:hypothetical protein